jgi:hypothetical protein
MLPVKSVSLIFGDRTKQIGTDLRKEIKKLCRSFFIIHCEADTVKIDFDVFLVIYDFCILFLTSVNVLKQQKPCSEI